MRKIAVFLAVSFIILQVLPFCGPTDFRSGKDKGKPKGVYYNYSGFDLGFFEKLGLRYPLPEDPKTIGFQLFLYPPNGEETEVNISTLTSSSKVKLNIKPNAMLMFLVHGFDGSRSDWEDLIPIAWKAKTPNLHLFLVDWAAGARKKWSDLHKLARYPHAASNARVVGSILGNVISAIKKREQYSIRRVYCVGFSLGAHVCGFAGKVYKKLNELPGGGGDVIDRITGLDPAGPFFKKKEPNSRLDRTDAKFVDIIHTNKKRLGMNRAIGHVDFWVGKRGSWGNSQPGCPSNAAAVARQMKNGLDSLKNRLKISSRTKRFSRENWFSEQDNPMCSHLRAMLYFMQSFDGTCKYKIPNTGGLQMGYYAKKEKIPPSRQNINVTIKESFPFCSEFE